MTKEEVNEFLKLICEVRDDLKDTKKALQIFSSSDNWDAKYNKQSEGPGKFNFLDYDPRIIADRGLRELEAAMIKLDEGWFKYIEVIRAE